MYVYYANVHYKNKQKRKKKKNRKIKNPKFDFSLATTMNHFRKMKNKKE